jgi:2-isopropylmalate synthase
MQHAKSGYPDNHALHAVHACEQGKEAIMNMNGKKITIFDTTLRDGEQAAGTRLGPDDKLKIAMSLAKLGVDVIEAGFPASSDEDARAVRLIASEVRDRTICCLSRAVQADIEACAKALGHAAFPRIHTGIGVSDVHITGKFRDERYGVSLAEKKERIMNMAAEAVRTARKYADDVEFYAEDAGRADPGYVASVMDAVISAGATVFNIADSTGYTVPEQFGALTAFLVSVAAGRVRISVHCHNDLGLATANTLAGIRNGADQIEGTINGIGERAGNAALEEVIMTLYTRKDEYPYSISVNTGELCPVSRLVAEKMRMPVPENKAVVGARAFAHSSGIHVDGVLKHRETYEIMDPLSVGSKGTMIILTARSGRHALRYRLNGLGYHPGLPDLERIYRDFIVLADRTREVTDNDLHKLMVS